MYQVLHNQIKENRLEVFRHVFIVILLWGLDIALPYLSGIYIDYIINDIHLNIFVAFIAIIAIMNFAQLVFRYFQSIVSTRLTKTMAYKISNKVFQKLFLADVKGYSNVDSAYCVDQINNDSHAVARFFTSYVVNSFIQFATIIFSGAIIFRADAMLSIIVLLLVPFYLVTFALNRKRMYTAKADAKKYASEHFSVFSEQITKRLYVKRNSLGPEMEERLKRTFQQMLDFSIKSVRIEFIFTNLNQIVIIIAYLCIISIGGYKVSSGTLSIGYFSIINTYLNGPDRW